jgi:hypothetical protein
MTDCWGCKRHAETGMDGFVQAGCVDCIARDIAISPAGRGWEANPEALTAEMRRAWPVEADFRKGRLAVWAQIKAREAENAT